MGRSTMRILLLTPVTPDTRAASLPAVATSFIVSACPLSVT